MALDETQRKTIYEGDGTVTQFAFSFVVFQPSDIAVYSSTDGGYGIRADFRAGLHRSP